MAAGGVQVDVRSNVDRAMALVREMREDIQTKATYRALNRAQDKVATETGREIRKRYNVKQRVIAAALKKLRANRSVLLARLVVEGVRLPLIEFDARWRPGQKVGATVKVLTGGGRKAVRGAFIAMVNGRRQVLRRVGKGRLPIRTLKSVSVPQAFSNEVVLKVLEAVAAETFDKNFQQQIRHLSGGL